MLSKKIFTPAIGLLFSFCSVANDYPVTVKGSVFGIDWASSTKKRFPLAGAIVELVDSDADGSQLFDDVINTAVVNQDGSFEVSGNGGDPGNFSWSRPDIYVRFVYNYHGKVRLTDELNRTRYSNTPEHDHDNFVGTLDIGNWVIEDDISQGESSEAAIWYQVCRAWDDYINIMGEEPKPGFCDVEYWSAIYAGTPWTNDNTIHWPIHYSSGGAKHEFAHLIRHSFDGDRDHFNWDVTRFRYARNHTQCARDCNNWSTETKEMNEAFAFNEGWAEFWARDYDCAMNYSAQCEGGVAYTLKHIEETITGKIPTPRQFMVRVLKNNPGGIHNIGDYIAKMNILAGLTLYSSTTAKPPVIMKPRPLPAIVNSNTIVLRNSERVNSAISTVTSILIKGTSLARTNLPCNEGPCYVTAENALNGTGLSTQRNFLLLEQEMFQKNSQQSSPDAIEKMKQNNTFDKQMVAMKSTYNARINEIIQEGYKQLISTLQSNKEPDEYTTAVLADIQSKWSRLNNRGRSGGETAGQNNYSFSKTASIRNE